MERNGADLVSAASSFRHLGVMHLKKGRRKSRDEALDECSVVGAAFTAPG
jgi:hypothetical protein